MSVCWQHLKTRSVRGRHRQIEYECQQYWQHILKTKSEVDISRQVRKLLFFLSFSCLFVLLFTIWLLFLLFSSELKITTTCHRMINKNSSWLLTFSKSGDLSSDRVNSLASSSVKSAANTWKHKQQEQWTGNVKIIPCWSSCKHCWLCCLQCPVCCFRSSSIPKVITLVKAGVKIHHRKEKGGGEENVWMWQQTLRV